MRCDKCLSVVDIEDLRDVRVVSFGGIGRDADPLDYEIPQDSVGLDVCVKCAAELVEEWGDLCLSALSGDRK